MCLLDTGSNNGNLPSQLVLSRNPLVGDIDRYVVGTGILFYVVCDLFEQADIPRSLLRHVDIAVNGQPVHWQQWKNTIIEYGDVVFIYPKIHGGGGGGKNPLATIAMIAVAAAAIWITGGGMAGIVVGALKKGAVGWFAAGSMSAGLLGTGIMLGGSLLIGALFPNAMSISQPPSYEDEKVHAIQSTQNSLRPYESLPLVVGKLQLAPDYAAQPYTVLGGNDQYLRNLFIISAGDVDPGEPYRIGDTHISQFAGANVFVHRNWRGGPLICFDLKIREEQEGVELTKEHEWVQRTSPLNTRHAIIMVNFNRGLTKLYPNGERASATVDFQIQYCLTGTNSWVTMGRVVKHVSDQSLIMPSWDSNTCWLTIPDDNGTVSIVYTQPSAYIAKLYIRVYIHTATWDDNPMDYYMWEVTVLENNYSGTISNNGSDVLIVGEGVYENNVSFSKSGMTTSMQRVGIDVSLPSAGQYDFRIRRLTDDADPNQSDPTVLDNSTLVAMQWHTTDKSINYRGRALTLVEVELKASDELSGQVSTFNCMVQSYGQVPSGHEFVRQLSQNPAALALELMTNADVNHRPIPWERIDKPAWRDFYNFCEQYGWKYNYCHTDGRTLGETLNNILAAGLGGINRNKSLYSVAWDAPDAPYVDMATQRTAWGFEIRKEFPIERIDGLRMEFVNEDKDYQVDERVVYADGVDASTAQNVQQWQMQGVTNADLIYKHARLRLAAMRLRPEILIWYTDWRSIDYKRGQKIRINYDTYLVGSGAGNVVRHIMNDSHQCVGVELDCYFDMDGDKSYIARDASKSSVKTWPLQTVQGSTSLAYFQQPVPKNQAPELMHVLAIGVSGHDSMEVTIQAIEPMDNFTCKITAIPSAPRILDAINGPIPPWESMLTTESYYQVGKPNPPTVPSNGIRTDEYVLKQLSNGALIPRIEVAFLLNELNGAMVDSVVLQIRRADGSDNWREEGTALGYDGVVYVEDVSEKVQYNIRLYAVSTSGVKSNFSPVYTTTVIGRTTPPPAPIAVHIDETRIWWEMPESYPIDVRGWEVWMGMDVDDPFDYAKKLTDPYTSIMEFDIRTWSGWARRVWIRTIDDIGLVSQPVSIAVNLGDVLVDNVVVEILENQDRRWPGQIGQGSIGPSRNLLPSTAEPFWQRDKFWQTSDFWEVKSTLPMTYTTTLQIPAIALDSWLSLKLDMPGGKISFIEYRLGKSIPIWQRENFWNTSGFWGWTPDSQWQVMPSKFFISKDASIIQVRVTTSAGSLGIINELHWIFDVEDEIDYANDINVPVGGIRVPLNKSFRWIKNISFGLEYFEDGQAVNAMWLDKGLMVNGLVNEGPLVMCRNASGQAVVGKVDVTMQGAKGRI